MRLYDDLTPWYHLIDPRADHADEAEAYRAAFERAAITSGTLLELGCGAGNNAWYLKGSFACVLSDLAPRMLDLSRAQNPECEHVAGDMRTLDLGRTFDAVLVHDAVCYMTTADDLRSVMQSAWRHLRVGGVAVFAPDVLREDFYERTNLIEGDDGARAVRGLEWTSDPDPNDSAYVVDYAFMLRDGASVEVVHDRHVEGMFTRAEWHALFEEVGFAIHHDTRPSDDGHEDLVFVVRKT